MKKSSFCLLFAAALSLGGFAVLGTGCQSVPENATPGVSSYNDGTLEITLSFPFDKTFKASQAAIENLKFKKVSEKPSETKATLVARSAEDRLIEIKLNAVGDKAVRVAIRVGVFGDRGTSQTVLEAIKDNL